MKASYATLIAERVRYYRNFLRLPQRFVAEILEVDRTTYSRMEAGKPELSASDLKILANLFHTSIEDFFNPLKVDTTEFKALADSAQYRLDKDKDFRIPDSEGVNAVGQAARDLLIWANEKANAEELKKRKKKASETYQKFKTISEALQFCGPLVQKNTIGNSLDIYQFIIDEFGAWISWNSFGAFSGVYLEKDIEFTKELKLPLPIIGINTSHPSERQRFSAAHELGHHLLGRKGKYGSPTKYVSDPDEKEANQFAADLLMGKTRVQEIMSDIRKTFSNKIDQINLILLTASHLQVSFSALVNRLISIGEIPFEEREKLLLTKVSELQKKITKPTKEQEFDEEEIVKKCEAKLRDTDFYKQDETFGGPKNTSDLRFLQDYCYVEYIQECKTKYPLDSSQIFQKVVSYISKAYPRYVNS